MVCMKQMACGYPVYSMGYENILYILLSENEVSILDTVPFVVFVLHKATNLLFVVTFIIYI